MLMSLIVPDGMGEPGQLSWGAGGWEKTNSWTCRSALSDAEQADLRKVQKRTGRRRQTRADTGAGEPRKYSAQFAMGG
jgi:hypothetical protein